MKLETAIEIAKACGLTTYREAYSNISYHAMNIFCYDEIDNELLELRGDLVPFMEKLDECFE